MNRRRIAAFSIVDVVVVAIIIVGVIAPNAAAEAATVSGEDPDLILHTSAALARETIARSLGSSSSATAAADTGIEEVDAPAPVDAPPPSAPVVTTPTTSANDNDTNNSGNNDKNLAYDGTDLIEWINANGGFIHENARIGLDPTGMYRGVFVKNQKKILLEHNNENEPPPRTMDEGIEEGDIIARIPWDLIIKPDDYAENNYWSCEAIHELHRQFQLGDESKYAPYVNYLKNQPGGRIPSEWTMAGKQLLYTILDRPNNSVLRNNDDESEDDEQGVGGLPPHNHLKGYEETWIQECHGADTPLARAAFYQFTSRDEDTLMVPFYDMHNHSNDPKKLNTISYKPTKKGRPFVLRALRDIMPGEQIYISYNRCHRCWFDEEYKDCVSYSHYGTSEVFDVFGFVEDYPQMWKFRMKVPGGGGEQWDELKFCLERDEYDDDDDNNNNKRLVVTFGDNYVTKGEEPTEANILYLAEQLIRLHDLEVSMKNDQVLMETMPRYEWDMAWNYHQALMTSISAAMLASGLLPSEHDDSEDDDSGDGNNMGEEGRDEL